MTQRKFRKLILTSVPFDTEHLFIRYITENDAYDMFEYSSLPEVTKYLLWQPHLNICATEGYIESLQKRYVRGMYADWAIEHKESGKMIGTIGYANINSADMECEIGYVLSPCFQKRGYMTEALSKLIDLSFETFKFNKIILRIIDNNKSSRSLADKLGFSEETTVCMTIKEVPQNVVYYGLQYDEYKKMKQP